MVEMSLSGLPLPEPTPEQQMITITDLSVATEPLTKEGDVFYLLNYRWWRSWAEYVKQNPSVAANDGSSSENQSSVGLSILKRPSPIDNSDLVKHSDSEDSTIKDELREALVEGTDYILLPKEVWNQLFAWYGGGPTLARKVISCGLSQTELSVEVYPLKLQLYLIPKGVQSSIRISKKETVGELYRRVREIFGLVSEQACIWDYFGQRKHALMNDMEKSLDDLNIQMDQDILVEVIDNSGCMSSVRDNGSRVDELTVFVDPSKSSLSVAGGPMSKGFSRNSNKGLSHNQSTLREAEKIHGTIGVSTRGSAAGLTGLFNLGNTCYMNSAIQCLVHTPEFAAYFLDDYHQEINWKNPLGKVGELAVAFGDLLGKLWTPGRNSIAARPFKAKLSRFAPQFSGYNQHDSQELLAFLLDGLHEDLNRVKEKPYIQSRDADGRPDEEVADEYWSNHIARNNSIIVDVCQGQYKSTLTCPACDKISVTFDPFMYLSLPLQSTAKIPASSRSLLVSTDRSQKLVDKCETTCVENLPEVKNGLVTKKGRNEPLSLYACLEAFLREEPLVPEDMWLCPQCNKQRQASKKLDLWKLPEVLVIHLKRFTYSRSMKHKLETFVNFPVHDLDLTNYVADKRTSRQQRYELYALINHYGGMGSGHYTAHIKLLDENKWYNFDDNHVSPINEDEVHSGAAYVLFYKRVKTGNDCASNGAQSSAGPN